MRLGRVVVVVVGFVAAVLAGAPVGAQEEAGAHFTEGSREFGVAVAQGTGLGIWGSEGKDVEDVRLAGLVPRWGFGVGDAVGAESWYHGQLELLIEGALLVAYGPQGGWLGGANLVLRYNWLRWGRAVPFVELGAGAAYLDLGLDSQSDGLAFTPQGGLGFHWALSERSFLTAAWRLHHVSNAGIYAHNVGINESLLLVGVTWFR
jgi:lipid A 3-O-deacylase